MTLCGKLSCDHCGQTFLVKEGESIKIDHFTDCPGLTDADSHVTGVTNES